MSQRFFVERPIVSSDAELTGDEARHLTAVMRARAGDDVVLFDGSGAEFSGRIVALEKQRVRLAIIERRETSRELSASLTLAVALPKGERQKWLVEKATELGVTQLVPLVTQRGVAQPTAGALQRLQRTVVEASKQCGRNRLLQVTEPATVSEYFAAESGEAIRLLAHPTGAGLPPAPAEGRICAAIGPEGGFTESEIAAACGAGWQTISLGRRILRVETAALAMAAWVAAGQPL